MTDIKLKVIPEPQEGTRTVLRGDDSDDPIIVRGEGTTSYACGKCGTRIVENVQPGQVRVVLRCKVCGTHNEIG